MTAMEYRFFKPFVGNKYFEGINNKKILVVGASFYCSYYDCEFFSKCTSDVIKDSSPFNNRCPQYIKDKKMLNQEPSYCIEDAPLTYRKFANYISKLVGCSSYKEAWNYLAFTNYVQFFLPCKNQSYRETRMTDLSERDFLAFNETLVELQPDIVIVWGCVFNSRVKEQNAYLVDEKKLQETEWYVCDLKLRVCQLNCVIVSDLKR